MLKRSRSRLSELRVGDSVRVGIPDVDRSRIEQRNLIGVGLEVRSSLNWLGDNICLSVMNAADTFYCWKAVCMDTKGTTILVWLTQ